MGRRKKPNNVSEDRKQQQWNATWKPDKEERNGQPEVPGDLGQGAALRCSRVLSLANSQDGILHFPGDTSIPTSTDTACKGGEARSPWGPKSKRDKKTLGEMQICASLAQSRATRAKLD